MLRVLVTGGAGYIGSHACKALASAGHTPIAFDNLRTGHRWAVKWGPLEHGDITDAAQVNEVLRRTKPDAVMHFAALAYVGESVSQPNLYYRTNVGGTLALLEAMRHKRIEKFVFSSTCATYGEPESLPIRETAEQRPVNPYGRSKLMAEEILRDYVSAYSLSAVALRYFNAAGADVQGEIGEEHDPEPHLIPLVLQTALGLRPHIEIYGEDYETADGACVRDYVHVSDIARAHVAAVERGVVNGFAAFNLGTGHGSSVKEVIEAARRVTGRTIAVKSAPRRQGDPPVLVADASLAEAVLGWAPEEGELDLIIESAWRWMSEHRFKVEPAFSVVEP